MNTQHTLSHLPLSSLRVSTTIAQRERRGQLDKGEIADLAESIATVGILQPLVVRPVARSAGLNYLPTDPTHEIVAGERRFLAARQAKLETVPVIVRELTDEQVLEVQLVENLQRADVHPMAEAEGYEGLHKLGRSVEEIADKVGKSKAYVYARMKLLDLGQAARKAFYAGKLTASTALYVARIPTAGGLQEDAVKEITATDWTGQPMSARRALEHIQETYMLRLADAPFKTSDATLVEAAGACGTCPKRTGNQKELFADVKGADVCTDPTCYRAKVQAHTERSIAKARESGQVVIEGAAAKKLLAHGKRDMPGFVHLDSQNYEDSKYRTYRQILGKSYVPTLVRNEKDGTVLEVAPVADLPKTAKRSASAGSSYDAKQKAEARKNDLEKRYRATVLRQLHDRVTKDVECTLNRVGLRIVAERLWHDLSHDAKGKLFKALDWPVDKQLVGRDYKLPTPIAQQTEADLTWFVQLLAIAAELEVYTYSSSKPAGIEGLARDYGIDAAAIRAGLVAEQKAKAKTAKNRNQPKRTK